MIFLRNGLRIGLRGGFLVQIDVPGKPRRSRGVPGSISGLKHRKTGPKFFSQTAFKYPGTAPSGTERILSGLGRTSSGARPAWELPRTADRRPSGGKGTRHIAHLEQDTEAYIRGPFKGPRGPFRGPQGPLKGPRCPFKGPRGPFKGPRGHFKGPRGP